MKLKDILNEDKHLIKEERAKMLRIFTKALTPFLNLLKYLDKELPSQAKKNPKMQADLKKLKSLEYEMNTAIDNWAEHLIDMDDKY